MLFRVTENPKALYELSDDQWDLVKGLFPSQGQGGRWLDHRTVLNGIVCILRSGAAWRDLPARYGKRHIVHHRFTRWRRDGTSDRVLRALQIRLDKVGKIDWDLAPNPWPTQTTATALRTQLSVTGLQNRGS
jgi:transposase